MATVYDSSLDISKNCCSTDLNVQHFHVIKAENEESGSQAEGA